MLMQKLISSKFILVFTAFYLLTFTIKAESPDPVRAKNGMVVSASKLASKVGLEILKRGGNAVDASVAVGFALAVTYPVAGNLGGGGFMVIRLHDGTTTTVDYREKAPLAAREDMFLNEKGEFVLKLSSEGVLSSGVPGSVAGLIYALEKYGTMRLEQVIQPAINLAMDGFPLDYRSAASFKSTMSEFKKYPSSLKVFSKNGISYEEGEIFKQPDLAKTLLRIKENGKDGFYSGETAELLVKQIRSLGGIITLEDLKKYTPVERIPVTGNYRGYEIISMGPPSAGGIALIQMLNVLENFIFNKEEWGSSRYLHMLVEAMKYVYADRSVHLGDEDFYPVPKDWLLSKEHAKEIFAKINFDKAIPSSEINPLSDGYFEESTETTHYSIYDSYGNAVSTTTTINSGYGNKIIVDGAGFLMNNEMDDFSSKPGAQNQFGLLGNEANAIQPEKRMLSSMTPTIVLKDNKPFMIIGSPGGSTIMTVVLQVILNCLDFTMDIQKAIDQPRIHHQWLPDEIRYEEFGLTIDVIEKLQKLGHKFGKPTSLGRAEGIIIDRLNNIIYGATDPRGFGAAAGY
jgi:gamma-glutamyltranspeptidase/glutathione hydrolase